MLLVVKMVQLCTVIIVVTLVQPAGCSIIFSLKNNIYRSEHLIRSTLREDLSSFCLHVVHTISCIGFVDKQVYVYSGLRKVKAKRPE